MKIGLKSDFTDYYDQHFDQGADCDLVWHRLAGENPDHIEQFTLLQALGFEIPASGVVRDIYESYQTTLNNLPDAKPEEKQKLLQSEFIIYPDLRGRSGTLKKMALEDAYRQHPECFAVSFLPMLQKVPVSQRLFLIGDRQFCIETRSDHEWCSTAGQSTSQLIKVNNPPNLRHLRAPLLAIDCMRRTIRGVYALSLDLAPRLQGTPVEEAISGEEVAQIIKERLEQLNGQT